MNTALQIVALIACLGIFFRAEPVLNQMGRDCALPIRLSFWLLVVGAVAVGSAIITGWQPTAPVALALSGMALLLNTERRVS